MFSALDFWRRWRWLVRSIACAALASAIFTGPCIVVANFGVNYRDLELSWGGIDGPGLYLTFHLHPKDFSIIQTPQPSWLAQRTALIGYGPLGSTIFTDRTRWNSSRWYSRYEWYSEENQVAYSLLQELPMQPRKVNLAILRVANLLQHTHFWSIFGALVLILSVPAANYHTACQVAGDTQNAKRDKLAGHPEAEPPSGMEWQYPISLVVVPIGAWLATLFDMEVFFGHFRPHLPEDSDNDGPPPDVPVR